MKTKLPARHRPKEALERSLPDRFRIESLESRLLLASLTSTAPYNGQQKVAVASNLTVTFASAMNAATLTNSTVILSDAAGTTLATSLSYNATTRVLTIDPTANLSQSNGYVSLRIVGGTNGVKGTDASTLSADYFTRFTTGQPVFSEIAAFSGLSNPTAVEFAADGRVFVAEKRGIIKVYSSLSDSSPDIFADLRTNVHNFWDRGLLGLALDPQFTTGRPYVYVLYSFDGDVGGTAPKWGTANVDDDPGANDGTTTISGRLSRLTANGNVMSGTEQVLINDWQAQFPSHAVGDLNFGPDGYLYASAGDGASFSAVDSGQYANNFNDPANQGGAMRAQDILSTGDPQSLDGTVIRIDPNTGAAAPSNPFASNPDANAKRIIAFGLRNPFRFTFRPGTSEIWIAETGWNTYEELNRIMNSSDTTAENFGWPAYEGSSRQPGYDAGNFPLLENLYASGTGAVNAPWFSYAHTDKVVAGSSEPVGSSTPTGVAFYTSNVFPAAYNGAMFFTDYSRKQIYVMYRGVDGLPDQSTRQVFRSLGSGAVDLIQGPDGNLYYADLLGGRIVRVVYAEAGESLPGTVIGTTGSYNNEGNTRDKAFDNDLNTYFDAPTIDGSWVGLDLGTARWVRQIKFAPRTNLPGRMVGGVFQGSNDATFNSGVVTLATISSTPAVGNFSTLSVNPSGQNFRYVRYVGPAGSYANIAEIKLYAGDGLATTYYNNIDYTGSTITRVEPSINFNWDQGSPDTSIGVDTFSARYTGKVQPTETGTYTFRTTSDDGVRLWVNNQLIIDRYIDQGATAVTGTIALTAGQLYDIRLDYYENGGGASLKLEWQTPTVGFALIPTNALFSVAANNNQLPIPVISSPTNALNWKVGDTISFTGSATDPEDGALLAASLSWQLVMIHASELDLNNTHEHVITSFAGVSSGSFVAPDHEYPSWLLLRLTATDSQGATTTQSLRLDPQTTNLSFASSPSGLKIAVNGSEFTTPFTRTVMTNSSNSVTAISPQVLTSTNYGFVSWSQGGNQSQALIAPLNNTTYTATYTAAPSAPTTLTAVALGTSSIQVGWVDTSGNETQFIIERRTGSSGTWSQVGFRSENTSTFIDVGLASGTEYHYRVYASNAAGSSQPTNIAVATTTTTGTLPAVPTALSAIVVTSQQVRLNWTDNANNETDFVVQRRFAGWIWEDLAPAGANAITYLDSTVIGNVVYEFRIAARNAIGTSAWSDPVTVNTSNVGAQPPAAPSALTAVAVSATRIDLAWSDNSSTETGFYVERRVLGGTFARIATTAANVRTYPDTTVTAGNTYEYRVIATTGTVDSTPSSTAVATTPGGVGVPNTPSNFNLSVLPNYSVSLGWTDNSSNETGFRIQRRYRGWIWEDLATVGPGSQAYSDSTVFRGVVYEYRIVALGPGGNSSPTDAIEAVIP